MLAFRQAIFAIVAVTAVIASPAPHKFNRMRCHAYRCAVYHCVDSPVAPTQDNLTITSNQNFYTSLGNDCGSITTIPLIKPVLSDADETDMIRCPSGRGLWLATYNFEIWRSRDHYAAGDHVQNWPNGTRWQGAANWRAVCNVDNGDVDCGRGDDQCKPKYEPRPGEILPP